jgi:O-antigen/teichoic acid export membrane protein
MSVGIYSVGYGIATYGAELLTVPIRDAIFPIYMDIYAKKGEEETKVFLGKSLRYFSLIAIPVVFGFIAISSDLIVLLASKKYMESSMFVPYVIIGLMIYGTWPFFGAGLFMQKKTFAIMILVGSSCLLNMMLNIALIPKYGIIGAAVATLIAYTFYILVLIVYSFRKFGFKIDYRHISLYFCVGFIMYVIINKMTILNLWISLSTKIIVGVILYFLIVSVFDKEVRSGLLKILRSYLAFGSRKAN